MKTLKKKLVNGTPEETLCHCWEMKVTLLKDSKQWGFLFHMNSKVPSIVQTSRVTKLFAYRSCRSCKLK